MINDDLRNNGAPKTVIVQPDEICRFSALMTFNKWSLCIIIIAPNTWFSVEQYTEQKCLHQNCNILAARYIQ